ncbi:MAG: UvrD-helicase domain-containing protein [Bacteroidaceae bacterium]|nr:UvrD-helicase domain-containing protein [Bacteroidaceae bacterium]
MDNKSHLTVYKASAGSGKTFRLAVQYITMLIKSPEDYRHILAVTFTNKATAEMKQRILSQLYGIGHSLDSSHSYYEEVKKAVTYNEQTIRHNALLALDMILQDYGRFRVETIDSFFQTVLRSLARELHIGANLTLELDTELVIDEAVDSFLANIEQDSKEKRNVMDFVENNIDNDRNWSIDGTLKKFSNELFREIFMERGDELRRILSKPDAIADYKQNLTTARESVLPAYTEKVKAIGAEIETALSTEGLDIDDLSSNPGKVVAKIINTTILDSDLSTTFSKCISYPDSFFRKKDLEDNPGYSTFAEEQLAPRFEQVEMLHTEYTRLKNTYDAALQYVHELSLLLGIRAEIDRQSQDQSRFILADTPQLLSKLSGSDTSFVYEKTGSFIQHLMIDEFQDTSRLQWGNLYLLLWECLANGKDCLVVGDVKQSIYRWRNSDWNILNSIMEDQLAVYHPQVIPMESNFRSHQNIIDFNNRLFPKAVEMLALNYKGETGVDYPALSQAYSTVGQKSSKADGKGYVYVQVDTKNDKDTDSTDKIFRQIEEQLDKLTQAGVKQTDIAILCRKGRQITDIAEWFAANRSDYKMISSEAFQLGSSASVRILINTLKWLTDSTDRIALAQLVRERECNIVNSGEPFDRLMADGLENRLPAAFRDQLESLRHMPLYELTEKLYTILELDRIPGQDQYVMAFFDTLCQWLSHNPGEPSAFLKEWEEKLSTTSIPATDIDGIRLLTIHKSKGLEFHTVIVPYCNWNVIEYQSGFRDERIWVDPQTEPFNAIPLLPVGFSQKLGISDFNAEYRQEAGLQTVDNLNLLYVALTRAESNLIVLSSKTKGTSVADTLIYALSSEFGCQPNEKESYIFESGQILAHIDKASVSNDNPFDCKPAPQELTLHSYPINARFRQSGESTRFVHSTDDSDDRQEEYIQTGKLLHSIFAAIRTMDDINPQVDIMYSQGLIETSKKADEIKDMISKHIAQSGVSSWFDGSYTLFNEASIIYRDGGILQTRRPDRVMIKPDGTAIIVDFKFGRDREEYLHQVREYMDLLRKMGYTHVEGHIWYVYTNKIINC